MLVEHGGDVSVYSFPALSIEEQLDMALGALADIAHMSDREARDNGPRRKAARIYEKLTGEPIQAERG